jgi:hypothetical protein
MSDAVAKSPATSLDQVPKPDAKRRGSRAFGGDQGPPGAHAGPGSPPTAHLHSAARTLEQILGELYPEHDWVVTVREGEGPNRQGDTTARVGLDEPGALGEHAGAVVHRDAATTADGHDDHGLDQAA